MREERRDNVIKTILCIIALTDLYPVNSSVGYANKVSKVHDARFKQCVAVANTAKRMNVDMVLAVSLAMEESGFNPNVVSSAGAIGVMQVLPRYLRCKKEQCDLIAEGLRILKTWMRLHPRNFLCHYNSGNRCNSQSRRYARRIRSRAHRWRLILNKSSQYVTTNAKRE